MFWQIVSFPACTSHVFLSHSQEDHDSLVRPIHDHLLQNGIVPWLDREDYYYGRSSRSSLRDGILRSRHVVFFVTDAMLQSPRGWCVLELAYSEFLELNFQHQGGELAHVFMPLFLIPQNDPRLPRSVWQAARDRGRFFDGATESTQVDWCVEQVQSFLLREQHLSLEMAVLSEQDSYFSNWLKTCPGRYERIAQFHPRRIAPS